MESYCLPGLGRGGHHTSACFRDYCEHGDPVVIGQPATRFVRNTDASKLDEYGYGFFKKAIPLDMLDRVVGETPSQRTSRTPFSKSTQMYTEELWRAPLSWGYGLPRFDVARTVGVMDCHTFA